MSTLSKDFYNKIISQRPLVMMVRFISRLVCTVLPPDAIKQLGFDSSWAKTHLKQFQTIQNYEVILPEEICPVLAKLSFLCLEKASNHIFPVSTSTKQDPLSMDLGSIRFALTRYSSDGMDKVLGTHLLPVASSLDKKLLYIVFQHAHTVTNPSHKFGLGRAHLPLNITIQRARYGPFALVTRRQRDSFSAWVRNCPHCLKQNDFTKGRYFVFRF